MLFSTTDILQTARMSQIFADFWKGFSLKKNNSNGARGFNLALFRLIRLIRQGQSPIRGKMLFSTADVLQTTQISQIFEDFFLIPSEYADFSQAEFFLQRTFLISRFRFSEASVGSEKPGYWLLQKLVPST